MGLRPATPSHGCRRARPRPGPAALDRARHANGGPLAAAPLPLPVWATAPANTDIRWAAEMIALSRPIACVTASRRGASLWWERSREKLLPLCAISGRLARGVRDDRLGRAPVVPTEARDTIAHPRTKQA